MVLVQRLGKEALISGADGAGEVGGVGVRVKVARWISHRVHLSRCCSHTGNASHRREKQGVRAAVMQQRTTCLDAHLLTDLIWSSG